MRVKAERDALAKELSARLLSEIVEVGNSGKLLFEVLRLLLNRIGEGEAAESQSPSLAGQAAKLYWDLLHAVDRASSDDERRLLLAAVLRMIVEGMEKYLEIDYFNRRGREIHETISTRPSSKH